MLCGFEESFKISLEGLGELVSTSLRRVSMSPSFIHVADGFLPKPWSTYLLANGRTLPKDANKHEYDPLSIDRNVM
jgi:hypothetical protein